MRFTAEHWRQRAQEAKDLASGVQDREVRRAILRIAEDYTAKAREMARDGLGPSRPHEPSRQSDPERATLGSAVAHFHP